MSILEEISFAVTDNPTISNTFRELLHHIASLHIIGYTGSPDLWEPTADGFMECPQLAGSVYLISEQHSFDRIVDTHSAMVAVTLFALQQLTWLQQGIYSERLQNLTDIWLDLMKDTPRIDHMVVLGFLGEDAA